jgi:hypothetical protein
MCVNKYGNGEDSDNDEPKTPALPLLGAESSTPEKAGEAKEDATNKYTQRIAELEETVKNLELKMEETLKVKDSDIAKLKSLVTVLRETKRKSRLLEQEAPEA